MWSSSFSSRPGDVTCIIFPQENKQVYHVQKESQLQQQSLNVQHVFDQHWMQSETSEHIINLLWQLFQTIINILNYN